MKLWDKGINTEKLIEDFTVGNDRLLDMHLAKYDVQASMAHAKMLGNIGIIENEEVVKLVDGLGKLGEQIKEGTFQIEEGFEDVHSKIEYELTQSLGDIGKKIHTGRSRNDQVLVCMHLYIKAEITEIKSLVKSLFELLIKLSNQHKNVLIPGYTHLQAAMPSSFGMWFGAYAESLIDDLHLLNAAYRIADQNPLGSAAGYGSSFPLDRTMTTELLEFETMKFNSIAAQMSRGKVEKTTAFAMASVAATLAKLAMDVTIYMNENFSFLTFPDELTTGSSIMPHKKNPDVFELLRAKCNKIQSLPTELTSIINNLPSGYHRDLQLVKESFIPTVESMKSCLEVATYSLAKIIIKEESTASKMVDTLYTVESINDLIKSGMPFRDAYKKVASSIVDNSYIPNKEINHTHEGSIGNLCNEKIVKKFESVY